MGLTVHYIDSDWNLCNFQLDIIPFANKHTGVNIAKEIIRVLEEFNISTRIISLTTDNEAAMLVCGREIADAFDDEISSMNFSHYRCAAHVLNLGVKNGLKTVDNSVMKARKLTNMIRNSTNLTNSLRSFCAVKNMKFLKLIQDIDIRWNSTFYMLQRFKALEPALALLAADERSISALYPDEEDWNSIRVN